MTRSWSRTDKGRGSWAPARPASALCFTAGYVDAYGYFGIGTHVFAANMTGNTVFFGTGLATGLSRGDWDQAAINLTAILAFFAGGIASSLVRQVSNRPFLCLLLAAGLVAPANDALLAAHHQLFLLAFAMGVQGAAMRRFGPARQQTVVVTGNLLRFADTTASHLRAKAGGSPAQETLGWLPLMSWVLYAAGAALEIVLGAPEVVPLALPVAVLLLTAADVAWFQKD